MTQRYSSPPAPAASAWPSEAFAADGARVHIADSNERAVNGVTEAHERMTGSVVDVSNPDAVERLLEDVGTKLGGLDVLVNNAGISGSTSPASDYDPVAWKAVINVNLNGTSYVTQRAIPLLKESGQASIIIMSSLASRFGYPNRIAYSTTKWGLVGFAKTLSMELGPHGITCNRLWCITVRGLVMAPGMAADQVTRCALGRPSSAMRFSAWTAILASARWPSRLCDRSPRPSTRLRRE